MQNLKKNWLVVWKITWGILQIFTRACESWDSKLGLLWGTFISSRKYISLKFTGELCVMTMKKMQILRENWFVVSKMTRIWWILIRALKSPKILHFDWFFLVIFDLKKCRGVIFHDTRKWCKIWRKTNFWFEK